MEGKKSWYVSYQHLGEDYTLFVEAETAEEAIAEFRASIVRLTPITAISRNAGQ